MSWPSIRQPDTGSRFRRLRNALLIGVAVTVTAIGLVTYGVDAFHRLELDTVDARFSIRGTEKPPSDIVVVRIDAATFNDLGVQWPFPRSLHAKVIDRLREDGAKAIAYDIQFTERTTLQGRVPIARRNKELLDAIGLEEDRSLALAAGRAHGHIVFATTEVGPRGQTNVFGGDDILRELGVRAANALLPTDPGGVNRRVPYEVGHLKSLSVVTTEIASGHSVSRSGFGDDRAWIDYAGPPRTIPSVSFSRVLEGKTRPGFFKGKIVVVGPSAPSLQDVHPTSTTGDDLMSGPEIQANAIATVRRGLSLDSSPGVLNVLLILLLGLVAPLSGLLLRPLIGVGLALAAGLLYLLAVQLVFNAGLVLPVVYPVGALGLALGGALAAHYLTAAFERERVREIFSRFVPDKVVDEVLRQRSGSPRLGGTRRQVTVMFSDLRSFTSFAESRPPERVIEVLNRYLGEMSEVILEQGGTLVAYMGDGIMAVFGAPTPQEDHADRAVAAAREMLVRLNSFNEWLRSSSPGDGFRMGIGLSSGPVMAGNVGGERRIEYAAIGDTTNIASRVESMTKDTPHQLLIADSTRTMLTREVSDLVYVEALKIRGKQASVSLWSLAEAGADDSQSTRATQPSLSTEESTTRR